MGKTRTVVRLSSKGQIVIPAEMRKRLGLKTGQPLVAHSGKGREVVFTPIEDAQPEADEILLRIRSAAARSGRDLVEEFHHRRRQERELQETRLAHRSP